MRNLKENFRFSPHIDGSASMSQQETTLRQMLPIFRWNGEFQGYASRGDTHRFGYVHRKVEAHIIRPNSYGTFDILVQQRSHNPLVDIGKGKFDQSMASHMTISDGLQPLNTLRRGLTAELGVENFSWYQLQTKLLLSKKYDPSEGQEQNNELSTCYLVSAENSDQIKTSSPKIQTITWMEWNKFLDFFRKFRELFTLTSQFYFDTPIMLQQIEKKSYEFLELNTPADVQEQDIGELVLAHIHHVGRVKKTISVTRNDLVQVQDLENLFSEV